MIHTITWINSIYIIWRGKKCVSKDFLLNASVFCHSGKDKIIVMENTIVVARGYGWREGENIKGNHEGVFLVHEIILHHPDYSGGHRCYACVNICRTSLHMGEKSQFSYLNIKKIKSQHIYYCFETVLHHITKYTCASYYCLLLLNNWSQWARVLFFLTHLLRNLHLTQNKQDCPFPMLLPTLILVFYFCHILGKVKLIYIYYSFNLYLFAYYWGWYLIVYSSPLYYPHYFLFFRDILLRTFPPHKNLLYQIHLALLLSPVVRKF